jgi:LacI family transcriptional regulator
MNRPTVIDIAREAGVSLATVDRVLNARPGVRAKTIDAVHGAIARLGYVRDMAAANLARSRSYRIVALLPDSESQFVQTLAEALSEAAALAAASRTELDLQRYPPEDMHILAERLSSLSPDEVAGVALMAPETPVIRDAIRALKARGIPLVALASDLPNTDRDHFIGTDSNAAGRTAGVLMGRFCRGQTGTVLAVADSMLLRDSIERRRGFDEVMLTSFPALRIRPTIETHGSPEALRRAVGDCLASLPDVVGIYLIGSGHRALAALLRDMGMLGRFVVIGHELTPHTRQALKAGHLDAVIAQNPGHLARSTLRVLRAKADRSPIDEGQEQLRIEVVIRENLPPEP